MARETPSNVFDVLVVGAGIAGCEAALAAAGTGARVALASAGPAFSGSSFFPGTWGLGLVGPGGAGGEKDVEDLVSAICEVGRGVAVPGLARALVRGVGPALARLEARGVGLRRAERADERDFVPCFDRAHRGWHGLGRASYRAATERSLRELGVRLLPRHELWGLLGERGAVAGASFVDMGDGRPRDVRAGAVVLATGGLGGLFSRTLTMPDVTGTAAAAALSRGARLVNVEFLQIMPGLVEPVRDVVFNEKTFRYAQVEGVDGPGAAALLDARGGHGPFSASLADRAVDLAVAAMGPRGASVRYELPERLPEFMQTYFSWFERAYGRRPDEGVRIAPYAHASNGGILVDESAQTGVDGLFACGEAAGGMHGADRIGGLSSANALVFGQIAGSEAAAWAAGRANEKECQALAVTGTGEAVASPEAGEVLRELRRGMDERCLLARDEEGLRAQLGLLERLDARLGETRARVGDWRQAALCRRAELAVLSSRALVTAMLARTESRGAHHRADFPAEDPAQARPLAVELEGGRPVARPLGSGRFSPGDADAPRPDVLLGN